jgi:hypothetical protein
LERLWAGSGDQGEEQQRAVRDESMRRQLVPPIDSAGSVEKMVEKASDAN